MLPADAADVLRRSRLRCWVYVVISWQSFFGRFALDVVIEVFEVGRFADDVHVLFSFPRECHYTRGQATLTDGMLEYGATGRSVEPIVINIDLGRS